MTRYTVITPELMEQLRAAARERRWNDYEELMQNHSQRDADYQLGKEVMQHVTDLAAAREAELPDPFAAQRDEPTLRTDLSSPKTRFKELIDGHIKVSREGQLVAECFPVDSRWRVRVPGARDLDFATKADALEHLRRMT